MKRLLRFFLFVALAVPALFRRKPTALHEQPAGTRSALKRWVFIGLVLLLVLGAGGFLVAASGILSITASSGHWAITEWFLNFAKERSVATHTIGKKAPKLDAPSLAIKGAAHYETECRSCHGSPDSPRPRVARGMTPPPPALTHVSSKYDPTELFYIVKHGIKLTGMPAWPAQNRDDEVWAVVAFLLLYPGLDAKEYRRLAFGQTQEVAVRNVPLPRSARETISESCARCHGMDGLGREDGAFPRLAGQKKDYLLASLQAYASGKRSSGMMEPIASEFNSDVIGALAEYYANLPESNRSAQRSDQSNAIERGRTIALNGIPSQRVPACVECHGPRASPRNRFYPLLSGQYPEYLLLQLELFKKKSRGGTPYSHLMHFVASGLTTEQMSDVAEYFGSLAPKIEPTALAAP